MRQIASNAIDDGSARSGRTSSAKTRNHPARPFSIVLNLSPEELTLLAALAEDQLFRKEFIDPKMPGYKTNPEEIRLGKSLVVRMRAILYGPAPHNMRTSHPAK